MCVCFCFIKFGESCEIIIVLVKLVLCFAVPSQVDFDSEANASTIHVMWDPGQDEDNIEGYTIIFHKSPRHETRQTVDLPADQFEYIFSNLGESHLSYPHFFYFSFSVKFVCADDELVLESAEKQYHSMYC